MEETSLGGSHIRFQKTLWSAVLKARDRSVPTGQEAFDRLARAYWKPAYFFIRRKGRSVEEAKDLTQGFFASLLERDALRTVDPERGRFRTFLLTVLERFLINESERAAAKKRGGSKIVVPLDVKAAERDLKTSADKPEEAFERAWGAEVLARAFERMRGEPHFEVLDLALTKGLGQTAIAEKLGLGSKEVENALYRSKRRFREVVLDEILGDVASREEAAEELKRILARFR